MQRMDIYTPSPFVIVTLIATLVILSVAPW